MLLSLDLGSRHVGLVALEDSLPARVIASAYLSVDPADLNRTSAQIIGSLELAVKTSADLAQPPPRMIIEWGRFYVPAKATPQATAAAGAAMGEARDPMICLRDRVEQRCQALGVAVVRIQAKVWRSRIGCQGRDDVAVALALSNHTPIDRLLTEHEQDAAGAAIGVLVGERSGAKPSTKRQGGKRVRPPRPPTPRQLARARQDAAADRLLPSAQARLAALPPPSPSVSPPRCPHGCGAPPHAGLCRRPYGRQP